MFLFLAFAVIVGLVLYYVLHDINYWSNKGVPYKSKFCLGMMGSMLLRIRSPAEIIKDMYDEFSTKRYFGIYAMGSRALMIKDPDLIKRVGVKDFDHFTDHRTFLDPDCDPLFSKNLFNLEGDKWRHMRATLSPSFTSSKMKIMFHLMKECAESFVKYFEDNVNLRDDVDVKDVFSRYANDVIGSLAFGVECDSLRHQDNEFYLMGKEATNISSFTKILGFLIAAISKSFARLINVRMFPKDCADFFLNLVEANMKYREEKNIKRQDMLQLMIDSLRNSEKKEREEEDVDVNTGFATVEEHIKPIVTQQVLSNEDITAQALLFFLAGFDSVSHLMKFLAYELAVNPDIQEKLLQEIDETNDQCNGRITYEALMKMKYLDMVICETLRKYPTLPLLDRICVKPYTIEAENPDETPVELEKGDGIAFPVYAFHHDEHYYPQPEKFDPERFNEENKKNINAYTYMPFGVGPRNCIGSRFALLEGKILFYSFLTKFQFVAVEKTVIPMEFSKILFIVTPKTPIILGFKRRETDKCKY